MRIFSGKKFSEDILENVGKEIKRRKISPTLAVIQVGNNPESEVYVRNKKKAASRIGIRVFSYRFRENVKQREVIDRIRELNEDVLIDGIIVQLPLPQQLSTDKIVASVDPKKDVDGFHEINRELLKSNNAYFSPVLPLAILIPLRVILEESKSKDIVTLSNSDIFGDTLKIFFKKNGIDSKYVMVGKRPLSEIIPELKSADVIISVCGRSQFIKGYMVKRGVALIDAGIRVIKNEIVGDVDEDSVKKKASFLTPVPGGIGPLTVALLLENVYLSTQNDLRR